MKKAIFPGTFDPFTLGHHSIVKRTLTFMDEVIIGIGINENKRCLLPIEKRLEGIRRLYADEPKVKVMAYSGLTVDFAQEQGAEFIVRGIRTVKDFQTAFDAFLAQNGLIFKPRCIDEYNRTDREKFHAFFNRHFNKEN